MAEVLSRPSSSSMSTSRLFNRLDERDLSPSRSYDPTSTGDWDYTSRDHTHSYATYALHTTAPKRLPMLNPDLFMISGQTNESQAGMLSWMHSMSSKQIAYHRQQLKFHQRELEYWQDLALMALDLFRSKGTQEDYSVLTERTYASLRGAGAQTERLREDSMGDDIPQPISHLTLDRPPLVRPAGSRFRSRRIPQKAAAKRTKQFLKEFAERIQRIFKGINLQFSNVTSNSSSHSFHPPSTTLPPKRTSSPSSSVNTSPHQTSTTLPSHQYTNSTSSITLNPAFDNTLPGYSFSSTTPLKFPAKKHPPPLSSAPNNSSNNSSNNNNNNSSSNNETPTHSPAIPKKPMNIRIQSLSNADQDQPSPTSQSGSGLFKITEERQASASRVSTSSLISPAVTAVAGNTLVELPKPKNANSAGFQQAVVSAVQQAQQTPPPPSNTSASATAPALPATRPSQHQRDSLIQIRQSQSGLAIAAAAAQSRPLKSAQYPTAQSARLSRAAVDAAIKGSSVKSPRSQSTSSVTTTMGTAKALHSYIESTHGAEYLSFNAGDVVLIVDDGSNVPGGGGGWWLVDLMGAIGYVPSNFFTRLEPT